MDSYIKPLEKIRICTLIVQGELIKRDQFIKAPGLGMWEQCADWLSTMPNVCCLYEDVSDSLSELVEEGKSSCPSTKDIRSFVLLFICILSC